MLPKSGDFDFTIIAMHGLGGNAGAWIRRSIPYDKHALFPRSAKIVIPQAPTQQVTMLERETTAWFDVLASSDEFVEGMTATDVYAAVDQTQLEQAALDGVSLFNSLVAEHDGDSSKVLVAGLSQGCTLSLAVFLMLDTAPGGIICMYGFQGLSTDNSVFDSIDVDLKNLTPIRILHGDSDMTISNEIAELTYLDLGAQGLRAHYTLYEGAGHFMTD